MGDHIFPPDAIRRFTLEDPPQGIARDLMDRHHSGMINLARDLCLLEEALHQRRTHREASLEQHLHRKRPLDALIPNLVDRTHASPPQFTPPGVFLSETPLGGPGLYGLIGKQAYICSRSPSPGSTLELDFLLDQLRDLPVVSSGREAQSDLQNLQGEILIPQKRKSISW